MIARLARRLGFAQSVPVSVVDDWLMPRDDEAVALAPLGGAASCLVDAVGRVQPSNGTYTLDWSLAAGARWVSAIEAERVSQRLVAPAEVETTIETPAGTIVQRVAAAVVDGQPVAVVEIENRGGVAIAIGLVVRPLVHGGRGFLHSVAVGPGGFDLGDQGSVHTSQVAATAVADGVDLLGRMPPADAGAVELQVVSRSGGAQAAAVLPLPHTATTRVLVELAGPVRPTAAVPTVDDVQRGWQRHLEAGASISVSDTDAEERMVVATRSLLTGRPGHRYLPATITALAELGFGDEARRLMVDLDRIDEGPELLAAVARWVQLGDVRAQLDRLDAIIGPVARAAHETTFVERLTGPAWMPDALDALATGLDLIDQPDVGENVRSLTVVEAMPRPDETLFKRSSPLAALAGPDVSARTVLAARAAVLSDRAGAVDLLPAIPVSWRGRAIDGLRLPIEQGSISFGLRWHGPRPAVLWEIDAEAPVRVTASAIDPDFSATDAKGETLLNDPGWPRS